MTMPRMAMLGLLLGLAGCATTPPAGDHREVRIVEPSPEAQAREAADVQGVVEGVRMIRHGQIMAAIEGPFDEVAGRYEAQYRGSKRVIYSARGMTDALLYSTTAASAKPDLATTVIGPAWALAYWGRGYAYNEMARYDDAIVELNKALALAPFDAQYNIEIGFAYQRKSAWQASLEHYELAEAYASVTTDEKSLTDVSCKALRGKGYDLVELRRYDEARAAYRGCLKLIPNEPRSTNELKYVDQLTQAASTR
jgi:tetratricopeptide (TPR) repeat protein